MPRPRYVDPKTGRLYEQRDGEFRAVDEVAADTGALEAGAISFGSTLAGLARGARMRAGQALGSNSIYYDALREQQGSDQALAGLRAEHPVASFLGGAAPYLAAPGVGAGLGVSAAAGAGIGLLEPTPDAAASVYLGAAGGAAPWAVAAGGRALRGSSAALPGTAGVLMEPGALAARAQARIRGAAGAEARTFGAGDGLAVDPVESLDDITRWGQAASAEDGAAVARGLDPEAARAARRMELGYDPALLGSRAMTADPGRVHQWAVDLFDRLGFRMTPGQRFNNRQVLQMEESARSTPWASAPFSAIDTVNRRKFHEIFNRAIGQEGEFVTVDHLNRAQDWVGETFAKQASAIDARGGVPAGGLDALNSSIIADWKASGIEIKDQISRFRRENATYSGEALLMARQRLNSLIRQAKSTGETTLIEPYSDMIEAIDGAIAATARSQGTEIARAREIYRILRAAERPGVWKNEQNILPGALYRAFRQGFRNEMRGAKETISPETSDLINVLRAREAVMPSIVGDSGTATRMSLQSLMANPVRSIAEGMLGRGAAEAYLGLGRASGRALTPQGAEQMGGIWGSTW